jgi:hypothetical protein
MAKTTKTTNPAGKRATTTRTKSTTPSAKTIAAEMACVGGRLFDILDTSEQEARWERLLQACEADWRKSIGSTLPSAAVRGAVAARLYQALSEPQQQQARKVEAWQGALNNIFADAGFRLGLAMGRGC